MRTMERAEVAGLARELARYVHRRQKYNGDHPYLDHLDQTVTVLERFEVTDPEILAAGYLHDALEDTELTAEDMARATTPRVAAIANALTDGPGANRRERKTRPYELIPRCHGAEEVKLADRIANVETAFATGNRRYKMYAKELPTIQERIRHKENEPPHLTRMWEHLERLLEGA